MAVTVAVWVGVGVVVAVAVAVTVGVLVGVDVLVVVGVAVGVGARVDVGVAVGVGTSPFRIWGNHALVASALQSISRCQIPSVDATWRVNPLLPSLLTARSAISGLPGTCPRLCQCWPPS